MKTYSGPKRLKERGKNLNISYNCPDCKNHSWFYVTFIRDENGFIVGEKRYCVTCK